MTAKTVLSIVTTLYDSARYIKEFHDRMSRVAQQITPDYEIIIVNDGSPDESLEIALSLYSIDEKITVIDLSRNFGHHKAILTGLAHAVGDFVFLIDIDLEEDPELLSVFWDEYHRLGNVDVVYGVQKSRRGGWFKRLSGGFFHYLINYLSEQRMPRNPIMARLMSRRYVRSLIEHRDEAVFIAGLMHITGYVQHPVIVDKHYKESTAYDFRKKLSVTVNSVTSFSDKPLKYIFQMGAFISLISGLYIVYLLCSYFFFSTPLSGWTSLIISIWFLGGLIIFFIGVIGIYLSKIFMEVKDRPYTIIRRIYRGNSDD